MANGHFGGGSGSVYDPYVIEDAFDLIGMQNISDADGDLYYVLAGDINLDPYIRENGWTGIWVHPTYGNKILQGAGYSIAFTADRTEPLFTSVHSVNKFKFTLKNLTIKTNSNTESDYILLSSSNGYMELDNVTVKYLASDISKVLFNGSVKCNYSRFYIYNSQDVKMTRARTVNILAGTSLYRCKVKYDLSIVDQDFTTLSRHQNTYMNLIPNLSKETVLCGSLIVDVCANFDDSYGLNTYNDAYVNLYMYIMDSCVDCYSTIYINVRNYIAYTGTEYYGDELPLYTTVNLYMYGCEQCYHSGEVYLMRQDTETYVAGDFMVYNLYSGGERITNQYVNMDKLKVCFYNKYEDVYERIQDGYLTDTEMKDRGYFTGFSFDEIDSLDGSGLWGISPSINSGYPFLWWYELEYNLVVKVQSNNSRIIVPIKRLGYDRSELIIYLKPLLRENRAIHLVDVTDSTALPIRIMTPNGIRAFSNKVFNYDFDMI